MGTDKTLCQQESGKRAPVDFKQSLHIAFGHPEMSRKHADRQLLTGAVFDDVSLGRTQPRRTCAAAPCNADKIILARHSSIRCCDTP